MVETINALNLIYGLYDRYNEFTHYLSFTPKSLREVGRHFFKKIFFREYHILSFWESIYFHLYEYLNSTINNNINKIFNKKNNNVANIENKKKIVEFISNSIKYFFIYKNFKKSVKISRYFLKYKLCKDEQIFTPFIIGVFKK